MFSSEDKIRPCLHSSSQAAATLGLKTSSAKTKLQNLGLQHEEFWFILWRITANPGLQEKWLLKCVFVCVHVHVYVRPWASCERMRPSRSIQQERSWRRLQPAMLNASRGYQAPAGYCTTAQLYLPAHTATIPSSAVTMTQCQCLLYLDWYNHNDAVPPTVLRLLQSQWRQTLVLLCNTAVFNQSMWYTL